MEYQHTVVLTIDGVPVFKRRHRRHRGLDRARPAPDHRGRGDQEPLPQHQARRQSRRARGRGGVRRAQPRRVATICLQSLIQGEGVPDVPRLHGIQIIGPYDARGISGTTASRERVFICRPQSASESDELPARRRSWGTSRARRFAGPSAATTSSRCSRSTTKGREIGGFEAGVQKGLMAILASTKFLYRAEPGGTPQNLEARRCVCGERPRARVAARVLPLERRARRGAARARGGRQAARARRCTTRK